MSRTIHAVLVFAFLAGLGALAYGQDAQVHGQVSDSTGAAVRKAVVRVVNLETDTELKAVTNEAGEYRAAGLAPGEYKVYATAPGFSTATTDTITLHVGQNAILDFSLKVGSETTEVTVNDDSASINTSDASVSTVIDRQFVQNIPLNGRSFQTLMYLSPGVVTASPQGNETGGISVNGQRTDGNNFIVDGLSGNSVAYAYASAGNSGMIGNSTVLGTTHSLLPVDAMQEFRMSTSTYTAELGRQPGAQVSVQSRSGTSQYHGDVYDYIRNSVFDANDWMNSYATPIIPTPAERQNDFGGAFGGPVIVPGVFSSRNRLFFFAAYEGLRLSLPQDATVYYVPSNGTFNTGRYTDTKLKDLRDDPKTAAFPDLVAVLNAFPVPNCSTAIFPQCIDYADGESPYLSSGAYPGRLNTYFLRADYQLTPGTRLFARYSDSDGSQLGTISAANNHLIVTRNRAFLLGADSAFFGVLANELRLQYAPATAIYSAPQNLSGGAVAANLNTLDGLPPVGGESVFVLNFASSPEAKFYAESYGTLQFQPNAVDTVSWTYGKHMFKAGADYRQTTAYVDDGQYARTPDVTYHFNNLTEFEKNYAHDITVANSKRQDVTVKNLGLFVQDTWRMNPRITLNMGLRWDFNPSPTISGAQQYTYTGNINDPSSLALSALGAPFYQNTYTNFQPRLGTAIVLRNRPGHETVLRAGGGLYYDLIALSSSVGGSNAGDSVGAGNTQKFTAPAEEIPFPIAPSVTLTPVTNPPSHPYAFDDLADPYLISPSTVHWNVSLEQGLGGFQSFTVGYVGSDGMNLIHRVEYSLAKVNPLFTTIQEYENGPGSNYNALQARWNRRPVHGLQYLASYTWAHSIDWSSNDNNIEPMQRGNSNHDVRNSFAAAMVYNLHGFFQNHLARYLASGWNVDLMFVTRSAFPVEQAGATIVDPVTGDEYTSTLNYSGRNPYVSKSGIPGGRQFDPSVFTVPASGVTGNAPRNFLRGFGEAAADAAFQRAFALYERASLEFRAEAFNVLNHPNFGAVNVLCGTTTAGTACTNPIMGQATNTISTALTSNASGPPGLASLYQQGGPRSLQFAVKLQF